MIDNFAIISSANIDKEYAGVKLGDNRFHDLSIYLPASQQLEDLFYRIAWRHDLDLPQFHSNIEFKEFYQPLFSEPDNKIFEIQTKILEEIKSAKEEIIIIQGYYADIPIVNKHLKAAVQRGVQVKFITSKVRDQPCYKY